MLKAALKLPPVGGQPAEAHPSRLGDVVQHTESYPHPCHDTNRAKEGVNGLFGRQYVPVVEQQGPENADAVNHRREEAVPGAPDLTTVTPLLALDADEQHDWEHAEIGTGPEEGGDAAFRAVNGQGVTGEACDNQHCRHNGQGDSHPGCRPAGCVLPALVFTPQRHKPTATREASQSIEWANCWPASKSPSSY